MEKITLPAKRKRSLKSLAALLGDVGFNRIEYEKDRLTIEKTKEDLRGNISTDYAISFTAKSIELSYSRGEKISILQKKIEMLPFFFNVLTIAKDYYEIDHTPLYAEVADVFQRLKETLNKEVIDLSVELNELKEKHANLLKRYEEVVRASEENSRLLLEAEQRYHELSIRVQKLEGFSDEVLKEQLFNWIKVHGGTLDVSEFAKFYSIPIGRVEEGLEMLIREGYIKKRS
jgi:hypothetical protein